MQNYAHDGSYYVELLSFLEANYPGLKENTNYLKQDCQFKPKIDIHIEHI